MSAGAQPNPVVDKLTTAVLQQDPKASITTQPIEDGGVACTIGVNDAFTHMAGETLTIVSDANGFTLSLEENLTPTAVEKVALDQGYEGVVAAAQKLTGFQPVTM